MKNFSIKEILQKKDFFLGQEVVVGGWIKSVRKQANFLFFSLNDGSSSEDLFVFLSKKNSFGEEEKIKYASGVLLKGKLFLTPERTQNCELRENQGGFFDTKFM